MGQRFRGANHIVMSGEQFLQSTPCLIEERPAGLKNRLLMKEGHTGAGHFERDPRGDKKDPGEKLMADFRERLKAYRAALSPAKRSLISDL